MFDYRPSILIIEDDPGIRRFVRIALENEGAAIAEAETVQRGLIEAGTAAAARASRRKSASATSRLIFPDAACRATASRYT